MSPLRIALLFHFNQNLNQFSHVASQVCYRGLLHVLRRHARLPFAIHISGSLIHALQWFDPEPLQLLADGINAGQFTLLGSTYAQNVPYASDDWDNLLQMTLHREVLLRTFGVEPTLFWNSERCWRQSLAPLLAAGGYTHTLIEGDFLRRAGCVQPHAVWQTGADDSRITLFDDDQPLKDAINYAIWTGRTTRALAYLRALAEQPDRDAYYVWYAEDAEAVGLWGYSDGVLPQSAWANLDRLLTELEQQPWLVVAAPGQAPAPRGYLPVVPDGQASWMVASLAASGKPYHEDGFRDWFDFNAHSPKLAYFRRFYTSIRDRLQASQAAPPANLAAARLIAQAHLALAAHQFEFGCIGIGEPGDRQWEMARAALVCLAAAALAAAAPPTPPQERPRADLAGADETFDWRSSRRQQLTREIGAAPGPEMRTWREDVNADGMEEICLASARLFVVLTPLGGRLLYAFDLQEGVSWVGNENAMHPASFSHDGAYPVITRTWPRRWLPSNFEADVSSFTATAADPRRLWGHFLPADWWQGEPETLPTYFVPPLAPDEPARWQPMAGQTRGLADFLWLDDRLVLQPNQNLAWDAQMDARGVTFAPAPGAVSLPPWAAVSKQVSIYQDGLEVTYRVQNNAAAPVSVRLVIENELCPASVDLLDAGRAALTCWQAEGFAQTQADAGTRGILNQAAGYLVVFHAQPAPAEVSVAEGFFALNLAPQFAWRLAPGESAALGLRWRGLRIGASAAADDR